MVKKFINVISLLFISCVILSNPKHENPFDPLFAPERTCSVNISGSDLIIFWAQSKDEDFISYSVIKALNASQIRDYLKKPLSEYPPGITEIAVINNILQTNINVSLLSLEKDYPTYFGVIYNTLKSRKTSNVATYTP